jgi:tellurite methyltransferase
VGARPRLQGRLEAAAIEPFVAEAKAMLESDRERWDRKYAAGEGPTHFEPNRLLTENQHLLDRGRALDVACGFGGNALYLASYGYCVDAVDVSGVGLARGQAEAKRRRLQVHFVQADLDCWWVPPARYDLIVVFHYLNRGLLPRLVAGLQPGGLLFYSTRNRRYLSIRPDFDPAFLLALGELQQFAEDAGLHVLECTDALPEEDTTSRLIARRPW